MEFTICRSNQAGNAKNCMYPVRVVVTDEEVMKEVIAYDHVCAEYQKDYRSITNFISSDVVVMDLDNDHSDNPSDWITEEKLDELMPDIPYVMAPSRHHMLEKDNQSARPRYHVYFPISKETSADRYAAIKAAIQKKFNFFDNNALDAARFIFGCECEDITWHDGWISIEDEIVIEDIDSEEDTSIHGTITEGSRNNTLSRFAGKVLKRYGDSDKAYEVFLEQADKCDPPLEQTELQTIWYSALKFFNKKIKTRDDYVAPEDFNDDFGGSLKPEDYSDVGEAKILCREYGDELKYTAATDYIRYDGTVWVEDKQMSVGACVEFLDLQLADANDQIEMAKSALIDAGASMDKVAQGSKALMKDAEPNLLPLIFNYLAAEKYYAFTMKRRDFKYIQATLNVAKPLLTMDVADLDKDESLLNTPDGTYNLTQGLAGRQEHNCFDLITKKTECSPGEKGKDIWADTLQTIFCGDNELIEYVQKIVGLSAIGKVYEEFLIIAYGDGANGKSTFWNTIARVLGSYSGKISSDILAMNSKVNAQPELAELKGKRLVIASEMQEGVRLNTSVVKHLCSTDEIQACKKYKDPFHFIPSHQVVLYTNHLPRVAANDDGIWRRLKVIPFNAKILGKSDIKNYSDYLFENAGEAIMAWIIEGAEKVSKSDYKVEDPKCVREAVESYRDENDWLGHFINECCEVGKEYSEKSGELYQQYRAYCTMSGEYTRSTTDFYAAVEKAGFLRQKTNKGKIVQGLKIKSGQEFGQ